MKFLYKLILRESTMFVLICMVLLASVYTDSFLTLENVTNVLRQSVPLGVVSLGLLYVILTGGIDLSVGSIMALVSVVLALAIPSMGLGGALTVSVISGVVVGTLAGILVAYFGIAPFIATLATMTVARGFALILSKGQPIFIDHQGFADFGTGYLFGVPLPFILLGIVVVIAGLIARQTVFGRLVIAVGSNETATRFSGVSIAKHKLAVYAISGFACAIAGIISSTRTGVGSPILAIGFELDAIAAVVVGGASLAGGRGTVVNTLIGVLILGIISNVMNLMSIPGYHQQVVKGTIIIIAVLLEGAKRRVGVVAN